MSTIVPPVSVVIPTYNREQQLVDSIKYVLANTYPDFELIVVDQTEEHTPAVASALNAFRQDDRFRYVQLPIANLPLARNVGLRHAEGEIIIYVDDDVELESDFIAAHAERYEDPTVGAVAGRIITPGMGAYQATEEQLSDRPPPGRLRLDGQHETHFNQTEYTGEVEWGQGCNMSFRRSALLEIDGFDERFIKNATHEEIDVFVRLRHAGGKVVFEPSACLRHLVTRTGGCRSTVAEVAHQKTTYRNMSLFFIKNYGLRGWGRYTLYALRAMYSFVRINRLSPVRYVELVRGHLDGVRSLWKDKGDQYSSKLDAAVDGEVTSENVAISKLNV